MLLLSHPTEQSIVSRNVYFPIYFAQPTLCINRSQDTHTHTHTIDSGFGNERQELMKRCDEPGTPTYR